MKILITGSLGFVATNLIFTLSKEKNFTINGVDSGISNSSNKKFTENLCNHNLIDLAQKNLLTDVDMVIHLAARGNVIESIKDPIMSFNSNFYSTINLLECMKEKNVKNLIFSSTGGALIGNCEPPVSEKSTPRPLSPYGASKMACEGYISSYAESFGIKSVVLRFGNVYGPYSSHKNGVINNWILSALNDKPIIVYGDGQSSRDYIHVKDLCDGIVLAIKYLKSKNTENFSIFHLAKNEEITLISLAKIISVINGRDLQINYYPNRRGEVYRNFANISKAKSILGFNPKISLNEGIKNIYDWLKINEGKN